MSEDTDSAELPETTEDIPLINLLPVSMQSHLRTPAPDHLWHYTSMGAMHSIVEQGEMYATDARFLNDRDELVYAAETLQRKPKAQRHSRDTMRQHQRCNVRA